jgi:hypothetical protein
VVIPHVTIQDLLNFVLILAINDHGGGGGACPQHGMGSGSTGDSLTTGKTGWRHQR